MKKVISLVLTLIMCISLCSCSSGNDVSQTATSDEEINVALAEIVVNLDNAYTSYKSAASLIVDHWYNATWYQSFFNKEYFEENPIIADSINKDCIKMWEYQESANELFDNALLAIKELTPTEGTQGYYDAVKEYYTCINTFKTLIQTWPSNYSQLTYSQAISAAISECDVAASELVFY